jgi:transcriptional regulator with XRE-family HTH domain
MSLTGNDKPRKPAEFIWWVATLARSQPELRERLIGDQVRQARRSAGLTQLELARTLKIALSKLSRYERGLDTMPLRLLLSSTILGLAVGRKALQGGLRSSQRLNQVPSRVEEDTRTSAPLQGARHGAPPRRGRGLERATAKIPWPCHASGAVSGREGGS